MDRVVFVAVCPHVFQRIGDHHRVRASWSWHDVHASHIEASPCVSGSRSALATEQIKQTNKALLTNDYRVGVIGEVGA